MDITKLALEHVRVVGLLWKVLSLLSIMCLQRASLDCAVGLVHFFFQTDFKSINIDRELELLEIFKTKISSS